MSKESINKKKPLGSENLLKMKVSVFYVTLSMQLPESLLYAHGGRTAMKVPMVN
jgi:hypothetical protein